MFSLSLVIVLASQSIVIAHSVQLKPPFNLAEQPNTNGSLTLLDAVFRTPCQDPVHLPIDNVLLGILPRKSDKPFADLPSIQVLKPIPTLFPGVIRMGVTNCQTEDTCFNDPENLLRIVDAGQGKIKIVYSSDEEELCLSVREKSKKAIFLPCKLESKGSKFIKVISSMFNSSLKSKGTKIIQEFKMGKDITVDSKTSLLSTIQKGLSLNGFVLRILGDSETCKMPRSNDECKAKNASLPLFDKGVCRAQTLAECPEDQNLIDGVCQVPTNLTAIEGCETVKFNRTANKTTCAKCNAFFIFDERRRKCVKGCPDGQFMLHDRNGTILECSDLKDKVFKIHVHPHSVGTNRFLNGKDSQWQSYVPDASFDNAVKFKLNGKDLLEADSGRRVSLRWAKYRTDNSSRQEIFNIKGHDDSNWQIHLLPYRNGRMARWSVQNRDNSRECIENGPEGALKYGSHFLCGPNTNSGYSFQLFAA